MPDERSISPICGHCGGQGHMGMREDCVPATNADTVCERCGGQGHVSPVCGRIHEMPESGKVIVAHPDQARGAAKASDDQGIPYLLRAVVPPGAIYVLDVDQFNLADFGVRGASGWRADA